MQSRDLILTALAPVIWGSSYIVTTSLLPGQSPLLVALLRALPAGLLLMLMVRQLPPLSWVPRLLVLGALNFSIFWSLLFVAAYRLPGGVAATLGAVQPLVVLFLSALMLKTPVRAAAVLAAGLSILGVALLVLTPSAELDGIGVFAGLAGAIAMAAGVVLSRKWQPPVSLLTFTAWQLTAGGLLLIPVTLWSLPAMPQLSGENLLGLAYMSLIGGAATYVLWFRGIARLEPSVVSLLGVLSPLSAVILGWLILGEVLTAKQAIGAGLALFSLWLGQSGLRWRRRRVASI
ncbi:EamA family transporter [Phaeobacter gallaeciensis]|uniref:Integral membrane protein PecM n=1 Tax=Phaeobacter gallaeciensis TaxID=60890 RepID=A0AAC9Z6K0_9RHOB|nr:EamA family transporter [Phaeobacter gallaeciensis]AHD08314.1 putative permease, DMT superfamily [Phaeobacter gallaeciensis DSM 26640]ATE91580.1 integral membrane protein PecM [Phaeobacter gallaeciensis]ATE95856.1 integral membrane protein PecM [Phaeobacter gallaeciensis]ATF00196.1 integral membrane protein PecM [Phaeobacter gallaeciensis]ATF04628.1 integral membrane protein PecM [Phaeobacter gallaeciensis]